MVNYIIFFNLLYSFIMKSYNFEPFNKKRSRFINPYCKKIKRGILDVILWGLGYYNDKFPSPNVPPDFSYPNPSKKIQTQNPTAIWINHCSFLIQVDGLHLLTDPIWSKRCSPFSFMGPERKHKLPFSLEELPPIDLVLISHDHYDHLDKQTVRKLHELYPSILWIVPLGMQTWMKKQQITRVVELSWWDEVFLEVEGHPPLEIKVSAVPSQHFSGRTFFDKNRRLWVGYVMEFKRFKSREKRLYFSGDTGYNKKDFKAIGTRFKKMDLSLIPIGTYVPKRFMDPVHIGPKEAIIIHQEVHSKLSIGMHWKTFRLSEEPLCQPPYDLYRALCEMRLNPEVFRVLDPGQEINW